MTFKLEAFRRFLTSNNLGIPAEKTLDSLPYRRYMGCLETCKKKDYTTNVIPMTGINKITWDARTGRIYKKIRLPIYETR